jgi:hypothetical protein
MNACIFSPDRNYRYLLIHKWNGLFPERVCMWIGLNPSIADELKLDNTLRRIRAFSAAAGFNSFYMVNLFALVATDPKVMKAHPAPVGPENDQHIERALKKVMTVFVAWGAHGKHFDRDRQVLALLRDRQVCCLALTREGCPKHPLYLKGTLRPIPYLMKDL